MMMVMLGTLALATLATSHPSRTWKTIADRSETTLFARTEAIVNAVNVTVTSVTMGSTVNVKHVWDVIRIWPIVIAVNVFVNMDFMGQNVSARMDLISVSHLTTKLVRIEETVTAVNVSVTRITLGNIANSAKKTTSCVLTMSLVSNVSFLSRKVKSARKSIKSVKVSTRLSSMRKLVGNLVFPCI